MTSPMPDIRDPVAGPIGLSHPPALRRKSWASNPARRWHASSTFQDADSESSNENGRPLAPPRPVRTAFMADMKAFLLDLQPTCLTERNLSTPHPALPHNGPHDRTTSAPTPVHPRDRPDAVAGVHRLESVAANRWQSACLLQEGPSVISVSSKDMLARRALTSRALEHSRVRPFVPNPSPRVRVNNANAAASPPETTLRRGPVNIRPCRRFACRYAVTQARRSGSPRAAFDNTWPLNRRLPPPTWPAIEAAMADLTRIAVPRPSHPREHSSACNRAGRLA